MMSKRIGENRKAGFSLRFGKLIFMLGVMLTLSVSALAQEPPVDGDPEAPFDGGISLLVAAGVAYGAKQWHNTRKKGQKEESPSE